MSGPHNAATYRLRAAQAYSSYTPSPNPDQARRAAFVRPIPTSSPSRFHVQRQLGCGAVALDLESFIEQYPHEAATYIFNRSPKLWNHRQIYAYADAYANHTLVIYIPPEVRLAEPIALHSLLDTCDAIDRYQACKINYVFDGRIAVKVTDDILGACALCATTCDEYYNCLNASCNKHFIACQSCIESFKMSCSSDCYQALENGTAKRRPLFKKTANACVL